MTGGVSATWVQQEFSDWGEQTTYFYPSTGGNHLHRVDAEQMHIISRLHEGTVVKSLVTAENECKGGVVSLNGSLPYQHHLTSSATDYQSGTSTIWVVDVNNPYQPPSCDPE